MTKLLVSSGRSWCCWYYGFIRRPFGLTVEFFFRFFCWIFLDITGLEDKSPASLGLAAYWNIAWVVWEYYTSWNAPHFHTEDPRIGLNDKTHRDPKSSWVSVSTRVWNRGLFARWFRSFKPGWLIDTKIICHRSFSIQPTAHSSKISKHFFIFCSHL